MSDGDPTRGERDMLIYGALCAAAAFVALALVFAAVWLKR